MPDVTHHVADHDVGDLRDVLHPEPLVAGADHDALRPRPLDQRAGRRVPIDQQLHLRRRGGSARRSGPTTPAGAITAMSALQRRRRCPCRSSASGNRASRPAAMTSAAVVSSVEAIAELEQLLEAARAIGQRALLLQLDLHLGQLLLQRLVLGCGPGAGRRSRPSRCRDAETTADAARCTSANTPKVTASSIGTPLARLHLRGNEEDVAQR